MKQRYDDLLALSPTPPLWFDEHGVPRFCAFAPSEVANIYAKEVVLYRVDCQGCGHSFHVAASWSELDFVMHQERPLSERVKELHYGDPPNVDCCPAGPTMNSEPRRTIEFWRRTLDGWERVPALEGVVLDEEDDGS